MTRDKILRAAKQLFEEKGFESASVREIATLAEVNVALINYHFGSKEQLLAELIEEMTAQTHLKLSDITKSSISPMQKINEAIDVLADKIYSNKRYYQMIHRELSTPQRPEMNDRIAKPLKRNRDELAKMIEEGLKKKVFKKDLDIDLTISTIFGLMYQTTHIGFRNKVIDIRLVDDETLKERVKIHLKEMLKNHLEK
jgi:TetR/AcrR family transcriptional regulator, fatty acid metabolism regulator protein